MGGCAYSLGVSGAPVLGDPGYQEYYGRRRSLSAVMFELRRVSAGYNQARQTALQRMAEQAAAADAHLVVGVEVGLTEQEAGDAHMVEYVVSGTAMRQERRSSSAPFLTSLSITDCWRLALAGYEPIGLAANTVVLYTRPAASTSQALRSRRWSGSRNQELIDLSTAATHARETCRARMEQQAAQHQGAGIIDMSLELHHHFGVGLTPEGPNSRNLGYANLHLTVHGLGSLIGPTPRSPQTTPLPVLGLH